MTWKILQGDVLDRLRDIPDESVQCCVTSPPYWSQRDYGVAGQIGMENTPDEHVAKLVEVFREVRRVLRSDGVCWVNYGLSYAASSSKPPTQLLQTPSAPGCDTDGREQRDSRGSGHACPGCGGECQGDSASRRAHNCCTRQPSSQGLPPDDSKDRDSELQGLEASRDEPDDVLSSTTSSSMPSALGASCQTTTASVDRRARRTWPDSSLGSARSSACSDDISQPSGSLIRRSLGIRVACLACGYYGIESLAFKPKDLIPTGWLLAMALQADGWWLRSDCIWHKPNPMPESVRDRPTKAHEYVFLLSKSARYFYDAEAIKETATNKAPGNTKPNKGVAEDPVRHRTRAALHTYGPVEKRNLRTVWTMTPDCYPEAHFAVFPEALAERCIMAGSRRGDVVLDPFAGSGTTLAVAERLGRDSIGIELNPAYIAMAERRIRAVDPTATVELGNGQQQKSLFGPDQ